MATYTSIFYECDNCPDGVVVVTKATAHGRYSTMTTNTAGECSVCDKHFDVSEALKLTKHKIQPNDQV